MELESVILVWVYYSSLILFLRAEFAVTYAYPYRRASLTLKASPYYPENYEA